MLQCYVVFVNRVGVEPGLRFWGGSHVYDPEGELVAEAPRDEPALSTPTSTSTRCAACAARCRCSRRRGSGC